MKLYRRRMFNMRIKGKNGKILKIRGVYRKQVKKHLNTEVESVCDASYPFEFERAGSFRFSTDVSKLDGDSNRLVVSPIHHFGCMAWRITVGKEIDMPPADHLFLYLDGNDEMGLAIFSCAVEVELRVLSQDATIPPISDTYTSTITGCDQAIGSQTFCLWSDLQKSKMKYLLNGVITVEAKIKIKSSSGFVRRRLSNFDLPTIFDTVLLVEGKRVYVSREYLSIHSPFFYKLFYGAFLENDKEEIVLNDVRHDEFIEFLKTFYPDEQEVTPETVEFLLELADRFDTRAVMKRCEEFLLETREMETSKKLLLAEKYRLAYVMEECLHEEVKTKEDLELVRDSKEFELFSDKMCRLLFLRAIRIPE